MKYIFGPVPSRRLGVSLGIDPVPLKTCSYNCIYCEVGLTTCLTTERREWVPWKEILEELREYLSIHGDEGLDYITFSGSGEPTLHRNIGDMIEEIKTLSRVPVAVLTNGSLLWDPETRRAIHEADLVLPSLDAVREAVWKKINRPHPSLSLEKIIEGLIKFREEYKGKIYLEILFVKDVNEGEVPYLLEYLRKIKPDKVQLNSVARPPPHSWVKPVDEEFLKKAGEILKGEIVCGFPGKKGYSPEIEEEILKALRIRPMDLPELQSLTGKRKVEIEKVLDKLEEEGKVRRVEYEGKFYFQGV